MGAKHYWKRNEILYLGELKEKYTGILTHWSKIVDMFNAKYSYDMTIPELQKAYETYYGGKTNGSRKRNK